MKLIFIISAVFALGFFAACKKENFISSPQAQILLSADTLHYDTVFTSAGSVTQFFKLTNNNNQKLRISEITLKGGASSAFKINADGFVGPQVKNVDLEAGDSIFVFVTANVNPSAANQPFIVRDSVAIAFNGNTRYVQLEAWAQNAHFFRNRKLTGNTVWTNDLPYVIIGGLQIDTTATLTIQKGCKIYAHADAPLLVDGTLVINGEKYDSTRVYFTGDRLDYPYNEYPASWPGIYFRNTSKNNVLQYAVIKNAYQAVVAQSASVNANPKLVLNECIIDNAYDAGLIGLATSINARNCLISNCAKNVQLIYGGLYQFIHCSMPTIANSYIEHKDPALFVSNFLQSGSNILTADLAATFTNCLVWAENGTADNEVVVSKQGNSIFNVSFTNCLWKVKDNPTNCTTANIINNQAPLFDSIDVAKRIFNFHLKQNSPAINKGAASSVNIDLDGKPRPVGLPDIGVYERQ